jgi:hypothetical protein
VNPHFDILIHGEHLAGLIAACLFAKKGFQVGLWVDSSRLQHRFGEEKITIPQHSTLFGHERSVVAQIHHLLNISLMFRHQSHVLQPGYQFLAEDAYLNITEDKAFLFDNLGCYFDEEKIEAVHKFILNVMELDAEADSWLNQCYLHLPYYCWNKWLKYYRWQRQCVWAIPFCEHEIYLSLQQLPAVLKKALLAPIAFMGNIEDAEYTTLHAIRILAAAYRGFMVFRNGSFSPANFYKEVALSLGAVEIPMCKGSFNIKRHISSFVAYNAKGDILYATDILLWNNLSTLSTALTAAPYCQRFLKQWETKCSSQKTWLSTSLIVQKQTLPALLGPLTCVHFPEKSASHIWLQLITAVASSFHFNSPNVLKPEKVDPKIVVGKLFYRADSNVVNEDIIEQASCQSAHVLEHLIPDLDRQSLFSSDSDLAIAPTAYQLPDSHFLGIMTRPIITPLNGLYLSGPDVHLGMGLEGAYHTAFHIYRSILATKKKTFTNP